MKATLDRLDAYLRTKRPKFYQHLYPGLDDAGVAELEQQLGFGLPDDLKALYRWKNGQDPELYEGIFYNRELMTAEGMAENAKMMAELLDAGEFEPGWWSKKWVAFLDNGGGDNHVVDVAGAFGGSPGQVLEFWHDDEDRVIVAPDLSGWLGALVDAFETLAWHDEEGNWEPEDEDAFDAFMTKRLPGYPKEHSAAEPLS